MSAKDKFFIKVWGDSHCCHDFPKVIKVHLGQTKYFHWPSINAWGGRRFNDAAVADITANMDIQGRLDRPQVHVLMLGSNNIRNQNDNQLSTRFEAVVQHAGGINNCHVVLCNYFPSPESDEHSKVRFIEASNSIKSLNQAFPNHTSFLNLAKGFTSFGEIENFYRDGIHLNRDGVERLVGLLKPHLYSSVRPKLQN